jgi:hypothetical protein
MKLVRESLDEAILPEKFEPFDIEKKETSKGIIYKFIERRPGFEGKREKGEPIIYTYSLKSGNIYYKNPDRYAMQTLAGDSPAFNKGNPEKFAIPNNFKKLKI